MKHYLIYLYQGLVVQVDYYDDEEYQIKQFNKVQDLLAERTPQTNLFPAVVYDEVQMHDEML